jgi:hypothetical protein
MMAAEDRGPWWRLIALLLVLILVAMDLLVWQFSGGTDVADAFRDMMIGAALAFGLACLALLLVSLGTLHRHMRWREQVFGLALFAGLGLSAAAWQLGDSIAALREQAGILLVGLSAAMAASGLVLGLLLALVTGRQHVADPLLDMHSTGGDVSLEIED